MFLNDMLLYFKLSVSCCFVGRGGGGRRRRPSLGKADLDTYCFLQISHFCFLHKINVSDSL